MRRRGFFSEKRLETTRLGATRIVVLGGAALLWGWGAAALPTPVGAEEDWRRFLGELNARGYDDLAPIYLKTFEETGTAPEGLAEENDLRLGLATYRSLASAPANVRESLAAQARTSLERFLSNNPDSPSAVDANSALASLSEIEGARAFAESTTPGLDDAKRDALRTKARTAFSDAKDRFEKALEGARERAKALQGDPSADADETLRAQATFLDSTIRAAAIRAQIGRTFPEGSDDRKTELESARSLLGKIYDKYRKYAGAFGARALEAEAAFDLGDLDGAAQICSELAVLPSESQFFALKTQNLLLFSKIALARQNPSELMSFVKRFSDWKNDKAAKSYHSSDEGLRVHLAAVRATLALEALRLEDKAAFVKAGLETFSDEKDPTYKLFNDAKKTKGTNRIVAFAFQNALFVADAGGTRAREAQKLLDAPPLNALDRANYSFGKKKKTDGKDETTPANEEVERAVAKLASARELLNAEPNSAKARLRFEDAARDAYDACKSALDELGEDASEDAADRLRLRSAEICLASARYDEAFEVAEAVVRGRRSFPDAPRGAIVALRAGRASLAEKRSRGADAEELAEESEKISDFADYVVGRWEKKPDEDAISDGSGKADGKADGNGPAVVDAAAVAVVQEARLAKSELAIARGDVDAARASLDAIPAESPERADAELRLGDALYRAWIEREATVDAGSDAGVDATSTTGNESADAAQASADAQTSENAQARESGGSTSTPDALLDGARRALNDGLERKLQSARGVSEDDARAIYSTYLLALIFARGNDADSAANAEKWLTHPVVGALTVVEKKLAEAAPAANGESKTPETSDAPDANGESEPNEPTEPLDANEFPNADFQMATLALALELATRDPKRLDDADALATRLETLAKRSPENASKPTGVYLRLGRSLERRLTELQSAIEAGDESKKSELEATTKGFESFLKRVSERDAGTRYASLRWVADSYLSLGRGLSAGARDVPPEAIVYFQSAGRTYQTILRKIDADPSFAPTPTTRLAVSLRIVETLRDAGAYRKAFDQAKELLKEAPNNLDVQRETARTLQSWGRQEPKALLTAIVGGAPDARGKNRFWGWNGVVSKLAPLADKDANYRAAFFDAYLEKTRCRFQYARRLTGDELDRAAREAENDLSRLYRTRPDLGGAASFAKFDSAFKNFQKLRGVDKPQSLRNAEKSSAEANADSSAKRAERRAATDGGATD